MTGRASQMPAPEDSATLWQQFVFGWISPLLFRNRIGQGDLRGTLCAVDDPAVLVQQLQRAWEVEKSERLAQWLRPAGCPPSLLFTLVWWQRKRVAWVVAWYAVFLVGFVAQPWLTASLLTALEEGGSSDTAGDSYIIAVSLSVVALLTPVVEHHAWYIGVRIGGQVTAALSGLVVQVAVNTPGGRTNAGEVASLVATDCPRVADEVWFLFLHWATWIPLLALGITLVALHRLVGMAGLCGAVVAACGVAVAMRRFMRATHAAQQDAALARDRRASLTTEVLSGVRTLRVSGWMEWASARISNSRVPEVLARARQGVFAALNAAVAYATPSLVTVTSISWFALFGGKVTPSVAFGTIFWLWTIAPALRSVPNFISAHGNVVASLTKLQAFVSRSAHAVDLAKPNMDANAAVAIENATYSWSEDAGPSLRHVTWSATVGELVVVTGVVGSGKSTLLLSLLGEVPVCLSGGTAVRGSVAYAAARPWLQSDSIRANILMGRPFEEDRYRAVLWATCIDEDLAGMPDGDRTLVGDRGVTLSGGQQSRVSLARACYSDSDVVLLDDVLGAVDARIGQRIFERCIVGLLAGKTVVLATHVARYTTMPQVSQVVQLAADGGLERITRRDAFPPERSPLSATAFGGHTDEVHNGEAATSEWQPPTSQTELDDDTDLSSVTHANRRRDARDYLEAWGRYKFLYIALLLTSIAAEYGAEGILAMWTGGVTRGNQGGSGAQSSLLLEYVFAVSIAVLCMFACIVTAKYGGLVSAAIVHDGMLRRVLRAPIAFFDVTPRGAVLTRFLRDVDVLATSIEGNIRAVCQLGVRLVGATLVMVSAIPAAALSLLMLVLPYRYLWRAYRVPSRELARLKQQSGAPVLSHATQATEGGVVIRAYRAQQFVFDQHLEYSRDHLEAYFASWVIGQWAHHRLEAMGAFVLACTAFLVVSSGMAPGQAGLCLSMATRFRVLLTFFLKGVAEADTHFVSVQRSLEFARLPSESAAEDDEDTAAVARGGSAWAAVASPFAKEMSRMESFVDAVLLRPPRDELLHAIPQLPLARTRSAGWGDEEKRGELLVSHVSLRYEDQRGRSACASRDASGPPALDDVSLHLPAGSRVGICGRTGSGKSSLLGALAALYQYEGVITLDGDDLQSHTPASVRRTVCAMLQEAQLFSGTVRENVCGPLVTATDDDVWRVLHRVGIAGSSGEGVEHINTLDDVVEAGGSNFSSGQRQLLSLARALLAHEHSARLFVFDEASSKVDAAADAVVHDAMLSLPCTVITILHRLDHISRFDVVVVMDAGRVVEQGPPGALLADPTSRLSSLVKSAQQQREHQPQRQV